MPDSEKKARMGWENQKLRGRKWKDKGKEQKTEQQGMTDTAMKSEVIQLTQEVLAEHVHIWNGTRHSTPNHGSIANAAT